MVECYGSEFEVPDLLIDKFLKDFDTLPGSGYREGFCQLRESIDEILDILSGVKVGGPSSYGDDSKWRLK